MKTCYVIPAFRAIADLVAPGELMPYWTITRINVPEKHRGNGIGTDMLEIVLHDADQQNVTLALQPQPSGPLNYDQLVAWYARHGFKWHRDTGYMIRRPNPQLKDAS